MVIYIFSWKGMLPLIQGCAVPSLAKLAHCSGFFKCCQCIFTIISPCNRSWPFNGRKFSPLHPRMLFVKFVVIGPAVLGKIVKRGQCIVTTCISLLSLLRIARTWPFIWRKGPGPSLKEIWIPFTQNFLCQVWFMLAQWFLRSCKQFTDRRRTAGDQKIFLELSALSSLVPYIWNLRCSILSFSSFCANSKFSLSVACNERTR